MSCDPCISTRPNPFPITSNTVSNHRFCPREHSQVRLPCPPSVPHWSDSSFTCHAIRAFPPDQTPSLSHLIPSPTIDSAPASIPKFDSLARQAFHIGVTRASHVMRSVHFHPTKPLPYHI